MLTIENFLKLRYNKSDILIYSYMITVSSLCNHRVFNHLWFETAYVFKVYSNEIIYDYIRKVVIVYDYNHNCKKTPEQRRRNINDVVMSRFILENIFSKQSDDFESE